MSLVEDIEECIENGMQDWPKMLLEMAIAIDKILKKLEITETHND